MSKVVEVDAGEFADAFYHIFDDLDQRLIEQKCGEAAVKVCKKYRPIIKANANAKIQRVTSKHPFANNYTVIPLQDSIGTYGAILWNRKYQLSHLVEEPHDVFGGHETHNEYDLFKDVSDPMADEYIDAVEKIIDDALKGEI